MKIPNRGLYLPVDYHIQLPTEMEEVDNLGHLLQTITWRARECKDIFDKAETSPSIGDFINAGADHPALIRYQYDSDKLAQGYRAGPLAVIRLRRESEQAVELWLDPDEELEKDMPESILLPFRKFRSKLFEMEHDGDLDLEFEIPQELIDELTLKPATNRYVLRTGTMRSLTRPNGIQLSEKTLLVLAAYEHAYYWRLRFKELVRQARLARDSIFRASKP